MREIRILLAGSNERIEKVVGDIQKTTIRSSKRNKIHIEQLSNRVEQKSGELEVPGFLIATSKRF